VIKIQIVVFWVVTPCSDVVGYKDFGRSCCLHPQDDVTNQEDLNVGIHFDQQILIKSRVVPVSPEHHAMKMCWCSGDMDPRILNLGTRLKCDVSFTPGEIFPGTRWIAG